MENEKKTFVDWIKEHKKELIIAGVSIAAIIAVIIGIKNQKALEEAWASLRKLVEKAPETMPVAKSVPDTDVSPVKEIVEINIISADRIPHDVVEHIRNLPEGWKASAQKIATAAEHGYNLLPGQTWVEAYKTGGMAA
jgi:predicted acylesterase/phospholipase RssA